MMKEESLSREESSREEMMEKRPQVVFEDYLLQMEEFYDQLKDAHDCNQELKDELLE